MAFSKALGIVVIKFHTWPSKCFHISITLQGHRATIGLVTATEMGMSAEDDDWSGGVNGTNHIEDQWPLVFCYQHVPAKEDKLSKAFKSLKANAHPASKKRSGPSWMASRDHCSFTMPSTFCTGVLTSLPVKSNRTPSAMTLRPNAVSKLRNLLLRGWSYCICPQR